MNLPAIGIDVGGTNLKFALVNKKGRILKEIILPTFGHLGKAMVLERVIEGVKQISSGIKKTKIPGLGLGTPGLVDAKGVVRGHTNIKGWADIPLKKILEKEFNLPAFIDNDANVMTLAEWACGGAKGAKNVVCLTLGTGVGGGIIIDGKLYHGTTLSAGEIGHIPINYKGPKCMCGNIGCLERYIGNKYITARANLTPKLLADRARKGDKAALKVWDEVAECLSAALSGVINFINPEKIIIGGGVANAGDALFKPLRKKVMEKAMPIPARRAKILKAVLGERAGVIGAAMLVFYNLRLRTYG